jgi:hypothetical protein
MKYQFTGKITEVGKVTPCSGKVKEKVTFIVRDDEDDGREIAFLLFDDNIDLFLGPIELGDMVKISFTIKTRKYTDQFGNVTYPTSCFATNVEKLEDKKQRSGRDRYRSREEQQQDDGPFGRAWREKWGRQQQQQGYKEPPPWESKQYESRTDWFIGCKNADDAKKRYRELCKLHHPDRPGGSTEKMQTINQQYDRWK